MVAPLTAQERRPTDAAPRGERKPTEAAVRGERPANPERNPSSGGSRSVFPAEIKLTDAQQAKLKEINADLAARQAELTKQRESLFTEDQRTAQSEVMKKLREGSYSRQEAGDLVAAALKLTLAQKTQIEATEQEARQIHQSAAKEKAALLTEEQRGILRQLAVASNVARTFSLPAELGLNDKQKADLKTLQEELGPKLTDLTGKHSTLLTEERRLARESAYKDARESGKDRQATADAVDAALGLTAAEKAQLVEVEQSLRELNQQIRERITSLLTDSQRAELEKRFGGRGR